MFVDIDHNNIHLLERFLAVAGESLLSFRYFNKRPLSVIDNHVTTCLLLENGDPICYGHLDKEEDIVWLGIAAVEGQTGKGLGRKMMTYLVEKGRELDLPFIQLSVDLDNVAAQRLYEKFGFTILKKTTHYILMRLAY